MNPNSDLQKNLLSFHVTGDLISTNAEGLRSEIFRLLDQSEAASREWSIFRLELASAKMIDSVGLNMVVGVLKRVQKKGARMQVSYSSENVLRTFTFTRLDKHIELIKA